jgi:hypothetical protein
MPRPRAAAASAAPITRTSSGRRASSPAAGSRQQHMRHPAPRAPRPARPHRPAPPPRPEDHPLPVAMPPPCQPPTAPRTRQTALFQHPLDARRVLAYREHRCSFAPARGPPRGFAKKITVRAAPKPTRSRCRRAPRPATQTRTTQARSASTTPGSPHTLTLRDAEHGAGSGRCFPFMCWRGPVTGSGAIDQPHRVVGLGI